MLRFLVGFQCHAYTVAISENLPSVVILCLGILGLNPTGYDFAFQFSGVSKRSTIFSFEKKKSKNIGSDVWVYLY